jgi:hypothetical protein
VQNDVRGFGRLQKTGHIPECAKAARHHAALCRLALGGSITAAFRTACRCGPAFAIARAPSSRGSAGSRSWAKTHARAPLP